MRAKHPIISVTESFRGGRVNASTIFLPGNKPDLKMQLIMTPLILRLRDTSRRA